jgi:hypothetical protein
MPTLTFVFDNGFVRAATVTSLLAITGTSFVEKWQDDAYRSFLLNLEGTENP